MRRTAALAAGGALLLVVGAGLASARGGADDSSPTTWTAGSASFDGVPVTTLDGYGARGMHVVDYRHGAQVVLTLPVTNPGPTAVTVTGADLGQGPIALLTVVRVTPVEVPAGATRPVEVVAALGECRFFHERETQSYPDVTLTVDSDGRSSVQRVQLDRPLLVHSPMIVGCPDRKLNRQADNRS